MPARQPQFEQCAVASIYPPLYSLCSLRSRMQAAAHYAAILFLDWRTGGTSDYFRGTSELLTEYYLAEVLAYSEVVSGRVEVVQLPGGKVA